MGCAFASLEALGSGRSRLHPDVGLLGHYTDVSVDRVNGRGWASRLSWLQDLNLRIRKAAGVAGYRREIVMKHRCRQ